MRISINGENGLPEVYEITGATAFVDTTNECFVIAMDCPSLNAEIRAVCDMDFVYGDDDEKESEYNKLSQVYSGIATSLGLNGYVNLRIGAPTCPLDESWRVERMD